MILAARRTLLRQRFYIFALAFLMSGAGSSGAASSVIALSPPFNWTAAPPSQFGPVPRHVVVLGFWSAPPDPALPFRQDVNVVQSASSGSLRQDVDHHLRDLKAKYPGLRVLDRRANARCRSGVSQVVLVSLRTDTYNLAIESVYTVAQKRLFIGTYMREAGEVVYGTAKDSIEEMCPSR
ncbi:MAG TPA: hypothetical protein VGD50_08070 [Candidatus Baltobacteraceae bacterium]